MKKFIYYLFCVCLSFEELHAQIALVVKYDKEIDASSSYDTYPYRGAEAISYEVFKGECCRVNYDSLSSTSALNWPQTWKYSIVNSCVDHYYSEGGVRYGKGPTNTIIYTPRYFSRKTLSDLSHQRQKYSSVTPNREQLDLFKKDAVGYYAVIEVYGERPARRVRGDYIGKMTKNYAIGISRVSATKAAEDAYENAQVIYLENAPTGLDYGTRLAEEYKIVESGEYNCLKETEEPKSEKSGYYYYYGLWTCRTLYGYSSDEKLIAWELGCRNRTGCIALLVSNVFSVPKHIDKLGNLIPEPIADQLNEAISAKYKYKHDYHITEPEVYGRADAQRHNTLLK